MGEGGMPFDPDAGFEFDFEVQWDAEESRTNLQKHGIAFAEALEIFDDPYRIEFLSRQPSRSGIRRIIVGDICGTLYAMICTDRDGALRIISVRRARKGEQRHYRNRAKAS
jgi:uncharacterized protein